MPDITPPKAGEERYETIRATVSDGVLTWKYQLEGSYTSGSMHHDEDVSSWTNEEIVDLTCSMLCVENDQRDVIEVIWN